MAASPRSLRVRYGFCTTCQDLPITVYISLPEAEDAQVKQNSVKAAFIAWQEAVPDLLSFEFAASPQADQLLVTWQSLEAGKIGSYQYSYSVLPEGQYRFRATDIFLNPAHDPETLYRYALVQVGHALGLLGRSPYEGDALSWQASGVISKRDIATLRALYAIPSGTVLVD